MASKQPLVASGKDTEPVSIAASTTGNSQLSVREDSSSPKPSTMVPTASTEALSDDRDADKGKLSVREPGQQPGSHSSNSTLRVFWNNSWFLVPWELCTTAEAFMIQARQILVNTGFKPDTPIQLCTMQLIRILDGYYERLIRPGDQVTITMSRPGSASSFYLPGTTPGIIDGGPSINSTEYGRRTPNLPAYVIPTPPPPKPLPLPGARLVGDPASPVPVSAASFPSPVDIQGYDSGSGVPRTAVMDWPAIEPLSDDMIRSEDHMQYLKWKEKFATLGGETENNLSWMPAVLRDFVSRYKSISSSPVQTPAQEELEGNQNMQRAIASYMLASMDKLGPWISLVMQRMQITSRDADFKDVDMPACCLALIKALRAFEGPPGDLKVGHLLQECYRRKVFNRPAELELGELKKHVWAVARMLCLLNIWEQSNVHPDVGSRELFEAFYETLHIGPRQRRVVPAWSQGVNVVITDDLANALTFSDILSIPLSSLMRKTKSASQRWHSANSNPSSFLSTNRGKATNMFNVDDLDIETMSSIVDMQIIWTPVLSEHLSIQTGGDSDDDSVGTELTVQLSTGIRIFWFETESISWLGSLLLNRDQAELESVAREVTRTWSFLFHGVNEAKARRGYESMELPSWVSGYLDQYNQANAKGQPGAPKTKTLSDLEDGDLSQSRSMKWALENNLYKYSFEIQQHLHKNLRKYNVSKKGGYSYSLFPQFRGKILALRTFMDDQKPRSFFQLWKDRRDSLSYFTFWGVIIFGLTGVVLALASLAVAIVQTWAALKSMEA